MAMRTFPLAAENQRIVARLRPFDPQRFRLEPLKAGAPAADVRVPAREAAQLARRAARLVGGLPGGVVGAVAGGVGTDGRPGDTLLWQRGGNSLLVLPDQLALRLGDGVLAFSVPVQCDQSEAVEVHVSFVVGDPKRPAGLMAVTEERPRGPAVVVDTWGEAIVAFCWHVVLQVATSLAAEAGLDDDGAALIPVALYATPDALVVTPMARHAFDRLGA